MIAGLNLSLEGLKTEEEKVIRGLVDLIKDRNMKEYYELFSPLGKEVLEGRDRIIRNMRSTMRLAGMDL